MGEKAVEEEVEEEEAEAEAEAVEEPLNRTLPQLTMSNLWENFQKCLLVIGHAQMTL